MNYLILYDGNQVVINIHGKQICCDLHAPYLLQINTDVYRYSCHIIHAKDYINEAVCDIGHPEFSYYEYIKTLTKKEHNFNNNSWR